MTTTPVAPKPIRSPSYPNMSLREAVDEVAKIESQYRSAPVDRIVAAKLIGYTSLSGPANKALAALGSYGLLESAGKGESRVTERARDILHAPNQEARLRSLADAAFEPDLFRELRERFVGVPIPPEDGVVTYLNRQGFNPNAVRPAAKAFLDTMRYLEELGVSESHGDQNPPGENKPAHNDTGTPMEQTVTERTERRAFDFSNPPPQLVTTREIFPLPEGEVSLVFPTVLSLESAEELSDRLEMVLKGVRRRAEMRANLKKGVASIPDEQQALSDLNDAAKKK